MPFVPQPDCTDKMIEAGGGSVPDTHFCAGARPSGLAVGCASAGWRGVDCKMGSLWLSARHPLTAPAPPRLSSPEPAGLGGNRVDTCAGDSGGPALLKRAGQPDVLVGEWRGARAAER